ncbi:hypothetical protein Taro_035993 [Colocasia esculenta]|uniref:Uncharacterized protein n=1 Tax=Colocasia esculenta TaxID=4460 RepID=A0A843WKC0_COLES|nr:hypothetical protein [Colocasia esculenta]
MPSEPPPPPPPPQERSPPKLLLHKPSKGQLKKAKGGSALAQALGYSRSDTSMDPSSPSPPSSAASELKPKKPFLRRIFPLLLVVNFAVGAYVLLRTTTKEPAEKDEEVAGEKEVASTPIESTKSEVPQQPPIQPVEAPKKVLPPIPQDQQRDLFKWILEEKRNVKPASSSEKKKIDEEKALLKQYIRAKSIPTL